MCVPRYVGTMYVDVGTVRRGASAVLYRTVPYCTILCNQPCGSARGIRADPGGVVAGYMPPARLLLAADPLK